MRAKGEKTEEREMEFHVDRFFTAVLTISTELLSVFCGSLSLEFLSMTAAVDGGIGGQRKGGRWSENTTRISIRRGERRVRLNPMP